MSLFEELERLLQTYAYRPLYPEPCFRALACDLKLPAGTLDRLAAEPARRRRRRVEA
jgi:hypothetical protein